MNDATDPHASDLDAPDLREEAYLNDVRSTTDLDALRALAASDHIATVLAVLENPHADVSVLNAIDIEHDVVNLQLLEHPQCPPTVIERLAESRWPTVRTRAHEVDAEHRRRKAERHAAGPPMPSPPVMDKLAADAVRRSTRLAPWFWTAEPFLTDKLAAWMEEQSDDWDDDMPAAIYDQVPTYDEAFFDLSDKGTKTYMAADTVGNGPKPPYLLERIVATHPRSAAALLNRAATKVIADAARVKPLEFDGMLRARPDGTTEDFLDNTNDLIKSIGALVEHPKLDKAHLKALMKLKAPEFRNLVALSPRAHAADLEELARSETAHPYLAVHPSDKVRRVQATLLGEAGEGGYRALIRGRLAMNPHIGDGAIDSILASGSPEELTGLAANTRLDPKTLRLLAQDRHPPTVHEALAANPKAPDEVLERWAQNEDPMMRTLVARNPGTPKAVLEARVATEGDPRVLEALASNPGLPEHAIRNLHRLKYVAGVAWNPRLPVDLQEAIAVGPDPQARYHLAQNQGAQPHVLLRLVDPALRATYNMTYAERQQERRIERAVSTNPNTPREALEHLATSLDSRTSIAAQVALWPPTA